VIRFLDCRVPFKKEEDENWQKQKDIYKKKGKEKRGFQGKLIK